MRKREGKRAEGQGLESGTERSRPRRFSSSPYRKICFTRELIPPAIDVSVGIRLL